MGIVLIKHTMLEICHPSLATIQKDRQEIRFLSVTRCIRMTLPALVPIGHSDR